MAMEARDLQWQESYHRVSRVLPTLTKRELDIIGDVADEFSKTRAGDAPSDAAAILDTGIRPLSEEELLAQIDRSIAQAARGEVRDAKEFEAEFDAELKAAYGI